VVVSGGGRFHAKGEAHLTQSPKLSRRASQDGSVRTTESATPRPRLRSTVRVFESRQMKSASLLLSSALLLTLAACSKQPQDAVPPSTTRTPAGLPTPASDPSLPSASVVASAPGTPVDAPASAPAGMPVPSSAPARASAASAP